MAKKCILCDIDWKDSFGGHHCGTARLIESLRDNYAIDLVDQGLICAMHTKYLPERCEICEETFGDEEE